MDTALNDLQAWVGRKESVPDRIGATPCIGAVVHGPLIATLLLDLVRRNAPGADVASFRFRAVRPTFDLHPFRVNGQLQADGRSVKLWAQDHEGWLTMDAVATLRREESPCKP